MKVWIDQDLCTGDGLCEEIAPAVFRLLDDGLAYVKEGDDVKSEPGGAERRRDRRRGLEDAVTEAAEECPASAYSQGGGMSVVARCAGRGGDGFARGPTPRRGRRGRKASDEGADLR